MKFICMVLFSLISVYLSVGNITSDKTTDAKEWLKNQSLSFVENEVQFTDSEGKPDKVSIFGGQDNIKNTCEIKTDYSYLK